ncbi:hypothetical protein K2173_026378 [Erythroxylum novogranatense]|uniref:Uncharacterized protein n=1 Tax=Erythroxylum novogranatense TaxID=1862640 RepID=A0AAV8SN61_9ROSI|nr:hypothetical protein K2173_026378 [Erythroxylum novogranatense]
MCSLTKSTSSCSVDDSDLRRGPWTLEEDNLLIRYIARHGEGRWNLVAERAGLRRTGKSCRLRWLNYLKPDVKRGNFSLQEQLLILDLHSNWGNRWSKIAQFLPGRTDNEIKNYWRTRVQKQARQLKIDANSSQFQGIIRSFWMRMFLQKIHGPTSSSAMSCSDCTSQPTNYASHHSALPPQPQWQEVHNQGQSDMAITMQGMEHHEQNSESERCTDSCLSSMESINISQTSQLPEYRTSPFQSVANNGDYSTSDKDCLIASNCNGMEAINLLTMSALGEIGNSVGNSHTDENGLVGCDFEDTLWNMDELWQFRNLQ